MVSVNQIQYQKQSHSRAGVNILKMSTAIVFLCFFAVATSYGQGCDMGNAYSYTDIWVEGENVDPDGDGTAEYDHSNPTRAYAVGQGVVENNYNTCGHEYYTETTMTGPDGSTASGEDSASLEIIIDGQYFAESQLFYYCPIANRDFESGFSSNFLETNTNEIYYAYQSEQLVGNFKVCKYRACVDTDRNPPNGCFFAGLQEYLEQPAPPCPMGVYAKYIKVRLPFIPFPPFCTLAIHNHLTFNPCPFGTL